MSLSVAYNTARSSLQASQSQMAVVSRNTSGASDPSYSRKIAALTTTGGYARITVLRASDQALLAKMLETTSDAATQKALLEGLQKLEPDDRRHGTGSITCGAHRRAEQRAPAICQCTGQSCAGAGIRQGRYGSGGYSEPRPPPRSKSIRLEADGGMAGSVARINDLLLKFEKANNQVMSGSALGADVSDAMDTRDSLIAQLSEEIGITVVPRAGNDIALYTDSGVPLFERTARTVDVRPTTVYGACHDGRDVFIDGVR